MRSARFGRLAVFTAVLAAILAAGAAAARAQAAVDFSATGHTFFGEWRATVAVGSGEWQPRDRVDVTVNVALDPAHLSALAAKGIKADQMVVLITAERTFDADGWMRLASDEKMSTLLTPAGLPIEGGVQGAVTTRYGYEFRTPVDQLVATPVSWPEPASAYTFSARAALPASLPPGLYRLRFDLGIKAGSRTLNLNGLSFATRGFSDQAGTSSYFYSPVFPASGTHVSGRVVDGTAIEPRFPWLLLSQYNSNGYRGVVADEDAARFATSDRSLIADEVVLPLYDSGGKPLTYSLEPQFPADTIDPLINIPWDWSSGELAVEITAPDGKVATLPAARLVRKSGNGPTTGLDMFTKWKPPTYGRYTVKATGWIADQWGRAYFGGGTYHFWIAKRMTLATATFQGMPYPVGSKYGRDIQLNPPVAARVTVAAQLFVNSDPANVRALAYEGTASAAGIFGAAQGMKSFVLDAPGEYHARIQATYVDGDGHLWVCVMRHAGVVYAEDSPVAAHGKKLLINGKFVERGHTQAEGYVDEDGTSHLQHITFPYNAGDVLLIASEGQGANKIEPVLTYRMRGDTTAWDSKLTGVGVTNLRIRTSNGYSPHLFPEYITDVEYYYGAAPRPGFMSRFIVGESTVRAPYWPVSPNSFGGQIGASSNGDLPGDIYRLIGGVVLRRAGKTPMYSGYVASGFLLPRGSNDNRVIAPGSEDLTAPTGERARLFLVGLRPGTAYEVNTAFRPAAQIDPILPATVRFVLHYPDGRQQIAQGVGDAFGSFAGPAAWTLDVPGVYRYELTASWNGFDGRMPGLPPGGGEFYVYSRPRGQKPTLQVTLPAQSTFPASGTLTINGTSTASTVHYAVLTPGAVLAQGDLRVTGGKFRYMFDPVAANAVAPTYDIVNIATQQPQIGRVVHISFCAAERDANGGTVFDFLRVIVRGTTVLIARPGDEPR